MAYEQIIASTEGMVGIIQLNRPQALNALSRQLQSEAAQARYSRRLGPSGARRDN